MQTYQRQTAGPKITERGAALVVSLILLLLMTIIGVAAMNGARLEVSMAGMMQREEVALRAAERTLAAAEGYIENLISNEPDYTVGGNYSEEAELDVSKTDWTDIARLTKTEVDALGEQDAFVVQYLGIIDVPNNRSLVDESSYDSSRRISDSQVNVYRITTRSETEGKAVRIVESTYTTDIK